MQPAGQIAISPRKGTHLKNEKVFLSIILIAAVCYFTLFLIISRNGYGDNIDNYTMLRSWQEMVGNGVYVPSRYQGNIPSEIALGFLASMFGPIGANGFSFALSIIALGILFHFFTEVCA